MQQFRKAAVTRASLLATAGFKKPAFGFKHTAKIASFSTYTRDSARFVQEKPKEDGFVYVKNNEEIERDEIMDKNFEKYLNAYSTSEDRMRLTLLLDPLPVEQRNFRERVGLYDWRYAIPFVMFWIYPLLYQEWIPWNNMRIVELLFLYNSWIWYSFVATRIGSPTDEGIRELLHEVQKSDVSIIKDLQNHIADNERLIGWESEVFEVLDITDELTVAQVDLFNAIEGHAFREAIATKLDALVSLETAAAQNIRNRMVTSVREEVKTLFATNKTAKEQAMAQAIAILTAGQGATMGKDIVGEAFTASVKAYQAKYQELPADGDDIYVALQKDMAAVITPVEFESTGGNVYETNLIKI